MYQVWNHIIMNQIINYLYFDLLSQNIIKIIQGHWQSMNPVWYEWSSSFAAWVLNIKQAKKQTEPKMVPNAIQ